VTRLVVKCAFGSTIATDPAAMTWTDITSRVDIRNSGVTIDRGARDELADTQPGTCSLLLDNSDGAFSPGLSSSPYYPNVRKGTPIRVSVVTTGKNLFTDPSFETGVDDWTPSATPSRAASTLHVFDGTQSMFIAFGASAGFQTVTSPVISGLTVGETYTFSAHVWIPAGDVAARLSLAGGNIGEASTQFDTWDRISVTFVATSTSHQVRVRAATIEDAVGDWMWVDGVQLEEGPVATAYDPVGARVHDRFWGTVNAWPTKWKGLYATASITATDLFKQLGKEEPLRSCLAEEIFTQSDLRAYYPLTEPDDSVSAGDISGVSPSTSALAQIQATSGGTGGTLEFSGEDGPDATSDQVPLFTPATSSQGRYLTADLGPDYENASSEKWIHIEFWFKTSTTASRYLVMLNSTDELYKLGLGLSPTGTLQVEWTTEGETTPYTQPVTSGVLTDGKWHHVVYDEKDQDVWVDGVNCAFAGVFLAYRLRHLHVGGYKLLRLFQGSIAHVALYATTSSSGAALATHYEAGMTAFSGESADARIERLASYVSVPSVTIVGSTHDPVAGQGPGGQTVLARMREVEQTEAAKLFADRAGFGLTYQSRDVRYNPDPTMEVFTVDYADLETDDVEISDDDQKLVNLFDVSRPGGATQRVKNQASIDLYGKYRPSGTESLLKTTDLAALDAANWVVSRYADPPPELREVPIEAYTLDAYPEILDGDISDYFSVMSMPEEAPTSTMRVTIEGYTETIRQASHLIRFHTSRSSTDSVWILDDVTYSVLDSTTRLAY
jgi:hypothetical protein